MEAHTELWGEKKLDALVRKKKSSFAIKYTPITIPLKKKTMLGPQQQDRQSNNE